MRLLKSDDNDNDGSNVLKSVENYEIKGFLNPGKIVFALSGKDCSVQVLLD